MFNKLLPSNEVAYCIKPYCDPLIGLPSYKENVASLQVSFKIRKLSGSGNRGDGHEASMSAGECLSKATNSSMDLLYTIKPRDPPLTYAQPPTPAKEK